MSHNVLGSLPWYNNREPSGPTNKKYNSGLRLYLCPDAQYIVYSLFDGAFYGGEYKEGGVSEKKSVITPIYWRCYVSYGRISVIFVIYI